MPSIDVPNPSAAELQFQLTSDYTMDETQSVPSIDVPPDFTSVSNVGELEFSTSKNVMDETRKFKTKLFFLRVLNTERSCYSFS